MSLRPARLTFLALLLLGAVQVLVYYPQMPETMASHFDLRGRPDGWSSRGAFFGIEVGTLGLLALLFLVLPGQLHRIPAAWINMPRKDYWLAPERRAASLARMGRYLVGFGCASLAVLLGVFELAIRANLPGVPGGQGFRTSWLWTLLGALGAFLVGWVIAMLRSFSPPRGP
ncbi:MAG: DUF1648 domain-containing protein [Planctomycetes bacterium]|nr:DUF1648 domain-containing protein [Planctomycetota bacterium]